MKPSQPRSTPMLDCTGRLGNLGVSIALEEEGTLLARGGHGTVNCRLSEAPKSRAYHGGTKGSNPLSSSRESSAKLTSSPSAAAAFRRWSPRSSVGQIAKNPDSLDALDQKVIESHALLGWSEAHPGSSGRGQGRRGTRNDRQTR